jgi:iron complex transport system permease protein
LQNPLADAGVLGPSAGASLGAVLAFYFGWYGAFHFALPLCAIAGALLTVAVLYAIAGRDGTITSIVIAGVAVNSIAGSATALLMNLSRTPGAAGDIMFWLMGSLAQSTSREVGLLLPFWLVGMVMLFATGRGLDALTLGEEVARTVGVNILRLRRRVVFGTALTIGASVAVAGAIGFVGLVVPYLLRPFVDNRPRLLLPASALGGGAFLLLADLLVRMLAGIAGELHIGVVMSLAGTPFLLILLFKTRREAA